MNGEYTDQNKCQYAFNLWWCNNFWQFFFSCLEEFKDVDKWQTMHFSFYSYSFLQFFRFRFHQYFFLLPSSYSPLFSVCSIHVITFFLLFPIFHFWKGFHSYFNTIFLLFLVQYFYRVPVSHLKSSALLLGYIFLCRYAFLFFYFFINLFDFYMFCTYFRFYYSFNFLLFCSSIHGLVFFFLWFVSSWQHFFVFIYFS